jgi:hypothetical protein
MIASLASLWIAFITAPPDKVFWVRLGIAPFVPFNIFFEKPYQRKK